MLNHIGNQTYRVIVPFTDLVDAQRHRNLAHNNRWHDKQKHMVDQWQPETPPPVGLKLGELPTLYLARIKADETVSKKSD